MATSARPVADTGRFDQENPERILSMLQVNIIALTELTRLVLPQLVARKRGKVMLLASLAAFQPGPGMAVYYVGDLGKFACRWAGA